MKKIYLMGVAMVSVVAFAWNTQAYADIYTVHEVEELIIKYDLQKNPGKVKEKKVSASRLLNDLSRGDTAGKNEILVAVVNCELPDEVHLAVWNTNREAIAIGSTSIKMVRGSFAEKVEDDRIVQTAIFSVGEMDGDGASSDDAVITAKYVFSELRNKHVPNDAGSANTFCVSSFKAIGSTGTLREARGIIKEASLKFLKPFTTQTDAPPLRPEQPIELMPALSLVQSVISGNPYFRVGDVVDTQYTVANVGDLPIGSLVVLSTKMDVSCDVSAVGNNDAFLDPGEQVTCYSTYAVTQADVDSGRFSNFAYAYGTSTKPVTPVTYSSGAALYTTVPSPFPKLALLLSIDSGNPYTGEGDVIGYSYFVANTGNETVTGIQVGDYFDMPDCGGIDTLNRGEDMTCNYSHTVTSIEEEQGFVTNRAVALGTSTSSVSVQASSSITARLAE